MEKKQYIIDSIRPGSVDKGRGHILYAQLSEKETDEMVTSATLEYILLKCIEEDYEVVNFKESVKKYLEHQIKFK